MATKIIESLSTASTDNGNNLLNQSKSEKAMQWWYLAPVIFAVVMFLLMGTIFERRIEGAWRSLLERRQARISQTEAPDTPATSISASRQAIKPSSASLNSCKMEAKMSSSMNNIKPETRSLY